MAADGFRIMRTRADDVRWVLRSRALASAAVVIIAGSGVTGAVAAWPAIESSFYDATGLVSPAEQAGLAETAQLRADLADAVARAETTLEDVPDADPWGQQRADLAEALANALALSEDADADAIRPVLGALLGSRLSLEEAVEVEARRLADVAAAALAETAASASSLLAGTAGVAGLDAERQALTDALAAADTISSTSDATATELDEVRVVVQSAADALYARQGALAAEAAAAPAPQQPPPAPAPAPAPAQPAPAPAPAAPVAPAQARATLGVKCDAVETVTFTATASGTTTISVSGATSASNQGSGAASVTVTFQGRVTVVATGGGTASITATPTVSCHG